MDDPLLGRRERIRAAARGAGARVLYLFGSHARGRPIPMSDVDFAVEFGPEVLPEEHSERQERLVVELMGILGRSDVDLAVLNRASALLKHRAVTEGVVLFESRPGAHADLLVRALRQYDDTRSLREATRAMLDAAYGP